jgi:hypothetical protein
MKSQNKALIKGWAVLLLVFALGGLTGAALDGLYRSRASTNPLSVKLNESNDYFESLKRELNLDSGQATQIRAILDEMRNEYGSICASVRPKYDDLRERGRSRMRSLLTPEQQKRFDSIALREDCASCPFLKK